MKKNIQNYLPIILIIAICLIGIILSNKPEHKLEFSNTPVVHYCFTKDNAECFVKGFIRFIPDSTTKIDNTKEGDLISHVILQRECIKYHSDSICDNIKSIIDSINVEFQKECPELTYYFISIQIDKGRTFSSPKREKSSK